MINLTISAPVLVVEDDIDDQYLIKAACKEIGIEAEFKFFNNGLEAYNYLSATTEKTFMILCDINMPVMNGLELRKKIMETEFLKRRSIPFIFLSTAARPSDVFEAYDMTVQGFFLKQSNFTEMQRMLGTIFEYWKKCSHPNNL